MRSISLIVVALAGALLAGCGASGHRAAATTPAATTTARSGTSTGPSPLQAEAASAAAGDIPDNQVFVAYPGKAFTMKFPEGWAQSGAGRTVTFRDKNNIVRVVITAGGAPTVASVQKEIAGLKGAKAKGSPTTLKLDGVPAIKATYETTSAPNAVTGKTVTLTVDRYELAKNGKRVIVDLGSPVGVDNVDAYRLMIQSLRVK